MASSPPPPSPKKSVRPVKTNFTVVYANFEAHAQNFNSGLSYCASHYSL